MNEQEYLDDESAKAIADNEAMIEAEHQREMTADKKYCASCYENFYNGNNALGVKECWNFKTAKVVEAFVIGWWIPQDKKENFTKVTTHDCHNEPGQRAFYLQLPEHLRRLQ